MHTEKEDI